MNKEMLKKFFELKAEQMLGKIYLGKYKQIGYTQDEIDLMMKNVSVEQKLNEVNEELMELLENNQDFFLSDDAQMILQTEAKNYIVSTERQRELTRERYGIALDVDSLID